MTAFRDIRYLATAAARSIRQGGIRGFQEVWQATSTRRELRPIRSMALWPPVETGSELADLSARLSWYVPPACSIDIPVVDAAIELEPVPWFEGHDQAVPDNASLVDPKLPNGHDAILVWKRDRKRTGGRPRGSKVLTVDPAYRGVTELSNYARISRAATDPSAVDVLRARSGETFARMVDELSGAKRVIVFGTGPSMRDIDPPTADAGLVIACNSAVRDAQWIDEWRPQLIVFADPVFHFGPSRYATQFRADLQTAVDIADSYVLVPEDLLPLLDRHMPALGDRIIGVKGVRSGRFLVPSVSRVAVARTSNVMTYLMLPLAAALGREIAVAGCDGRDPSEDYFWQHSQQGQYTDELMKSAMQAHPPYFRDRDYARYYQEHCDILASQFIAIEDRGINVTSVTASYIPALQQRAALAGP